MGIGNDRADPRLAILAAVALLLAAMATGFEARAEEVVGRGELHAAGNGFAVLVFRGQATVRGRGLLVAQRDDLLETRGEGRATPLGDGRVLLEGFGRVTVRSFRDRTRIEAAGARLRIWARGIGVAHLAGAGIYTTDDLEGSWGPDVRVEFESEE